MDFKAMSDKELAQRLARLLELLELLRLYGKLVSQDAVDITQEIALRAKRNKVS